MAALVCLVVPIATAVHMQNIVQAPAPPPSSCHIMSCIMSDHAYFLIHILQLPDASSLLLLRKKDYLLDSHEAAGSFSCAFYALPGEYDHHL